jgi:DNA-binding transcriptional LysR family regulator
MLRELKTFVCVVRRGTFAAAGQHVGLTQSAVSAQMRVLEEHLGAPLFDRTGRSVVLNAAGRHALPLAEQILALYAQMALSERDGQWLGELRVGAIASIQTGLLPEALTRLRDRAPRIDLKLIPGVSLNLLSLVDANEIDIALMIRPPFSLPKELVQLPLAREPFVLIAPADTKGDDPLKLLAEQPFIRYDRMSFGGRLVSRFCHEHRITVNETLELDELEGIARMVECGLGVSLVPHSGLWCEHKARLRVLSLDELTFYRDLVVVLRRGLRRQSAVTCLLDCLGVSFDHVLGQS